MVWIIWMQWMSIMFWLNYLNYTALVSFREGNEKSYQLLRDSLDLYLTINPDNVQHLLLQARLYFHLGIWPEKVRFFFFSNRIKSKYWLLFSTKHLLFSPLSSVPGARHPAAHSGIGSLPTWGSGLLGATHTGAHPAQETSCYTWGQEA